MNVGEKIKNNKTSISSRLINLFHVSIQPSHVTRRVASSPTDGERGNKSIYIVRYV